MPAQVARERERFTAYSDRTQGRNLLADLLGEEVKRQERIVAIDSEAVTLCPFASRVPFHMQLVPREPRARFEDDGAARRRGPARDARAARRRARRACRRSTSGCAPRPRDAEHYCWRIDLLPRLAQFAGLELGTGVNLCVLAPERAAERLRAATPAP